MPDTACVPTVGMEGPLTPQRIPPIDVRSTVLENLKTKINVSFSRMEGRGRESVCVCICVCVRERLDIYLCVRKTVHFVTQCNERPNGKDP